jgi:hypothetical protein
VEAILYCGVYLRLGVGYLFSHLSVFYIIPCFTFLPIARLLDTSESESAETEVPHR